MSTDESLGRALAKVVLISLGALTAFTGFGMAVEDRGCEVACGSADEQALRTILFAGTGIAGIAMTWTAARWRPGIWLSLLLIAAVLFVAGFVQGLSNLR